MATEMKIRLQDRQQDDDARNLRSPKSVDRTIEMQDDALTLKTEDARTV